MNILFVSEDLSADIFAPPIAMLMVWSIDWKKNVVTPSSRFSRFFLEASSREKKKVITEVARRANADQRRIYGISEKKNHSR